jgi:hypothetical protein
MDWIHVDLERTLWMVLVNSLVNIKNCGMSWLGESSIWVVNPVRSFSDVMFQQIPEIIVSVPYFWYTAPKNVHDCIPAPSRTECQFMQCEYW